MTIRRIHPIWGLNAALVLACAALVAGPVRHYGPVVPGAAVPWLVLCAGIALTERWPVHLEFRRSAHSFSLTDVPLALILLFEGGLGAVAAMAVGTSIAMWFRRLPPIKFAFNLAQFVLGACLGLVMVHAIAATDPGFGPRVWIGVALAAQTCGLVTITLLSTVIFLAEGTLTREQIRQMFGMDQVVTSMNTSLALLLGVILVKDPTATPILAVPLTIAFLGYRSYVNERQRHEKLEFLYEANRTLAGSPEVADALEGLLERALEAFRAERAEVVLLGADGGSSLRTSLGPGHERARMEPISATEAEALRDSVEGRTAPLLLQDPFPPSLAGYLEERGMRHGMVAGLRGEERLVGVLLLANRFGLTRGFTDDDLALFETLASNASSALQYDRLEQAVSDLRDLQGQLHHQAFHDPLTGLANRALFGQEVHTALTAGEAEVAVLFVDLDDFKGVNDTLGHAVGDRLLRGAAVRLAGCVRGEDLVARLGGDEFALLLRGRARAEEAGVDVARRILAAFAPPIEVGPHELPVGVSVGVATSAHSGGHAEDLLRDADVAMYEAKDSGKGRFAVFDPAMREAILRRHGLKEELERAIAQEELVVQMQPIVELTSGATVALEALVRWEHPDRGRIPPGEFIPLAEETGLVVALGRFVLREACRRARAWADAIPGGEAVVVQVNLSAIELDQDDLVPAVEDALEASGLEPARLVLEITETLLMQDAERGVATLAALREVGVRLALDDFGTGYSSLSYLRSLPLDVLKIAKPFVDGLAVSHDDVAFVRCIIDLASTVGLTVVAEGIESGGQLQVLRRLGCALGQGYHFSRPLDDEVEWLRSTPIAALGRRRRGAA